jgi:hypothetical protein
MLERAGHVTKAQETADGLAERYLAEVAERQGWGTFRKLRSCRQQYRTTAADERLLEEL